MAQQNRKLGFSHHSNMVVLVELVHMVLLKGMYPISQSLTELVDFPTCFPDCDDHRPSLLNLFLSSNPIICNISCLSPLGNSDHAVVNVDISLSSKTAQESPVHRMLYSYHQGDWDSFRDFLRDIPWKVVFDLQAEDCAREIVS